MNCHGHFTISLVTFWGCELKFIVPTFCFVLYIYFPSDKAEHFIQVFFCLFQT